MNARLTDILPESAAAAADGPYIGRSVQRVEDLRLLRGLGRYADDVTLPGMLHAAMLRSSVAHARVRGIDTSAARAMPGVHAVITAAEIAGVPGQPVPHRPAQAAATALHGTLSPAGDRAGPHPPCRRGARDRHR